MLDPLRPAKALRGPSRSARLERAVVRVHGSILAAFALITVLPALLARAMDLGALLTQVVPAVVYLGVAIDLQRHGERTRHLAILGALPIFMVAAGSTYPLWSYGASAFCVGAFALSAARLLRTSWYVAANLMVGVVWATGRGWLGGELWAGIDETLLASTMAFAAAVFTDVIAVAAREAERADEAARHARDTLLAEDAERRAVEQAERTMHDDVLHALRVVAGGDFTADVIRDTCRDAVASVERMSDRRSDTKASDPAPPIGVDALAASWEATPDLEIRVAVDIDTPRLPLDAASTRALGRAVGEALRNVARHAQCSRADITVRRTDGELHVDVVDHGVGLPIPHTPGFGMLRSIVDPVEQVGGRVAFSSNSGGGTTVTLRLPVTESKPTDLLTRHFDEVHRATGAPLPLPFLVIPIAIPFTYMSIRYAHSWEPWVAAPLFGLAYIAITAAVVRRLTRSAPSSIWLLAAVAILVALATSSLPLMPAGALLDGRSFPIGFQAVPLMALVSVLPLRIGLATLLPFPVLVATTYLLDPSLSNGQFPLGAAQACVLLPFCTLLVGRMIGRIGQRILEEEAELAALAEVHAERRSLALVADRHLDYTQRVVAPWLSDIATHRLDPTSEQVRHRAALLAANVRDDLFAPGFLNDQQREAATQFRALGGTLRLRPSSSDRRCDPETGAILIQLLGELDPRHTITVTPPRPGSRELRVAVVPAASSQGLGARGAVVEHDVFSTIVTIDIDDAHQEQP